MLLAFQEEFDGVSPPRALLGALRGAETLVALRNVQCRFAHNSTIQFGVTWALHLGRCAAGEFRQVAAGGVTCDVWYTRGR